MNAVVVSHVSKAFGAVEAVKDVSFDVREGEIFGFLGPNGAGKTTTIRMMLDILQPDAGTIDVLGHPLREETKDRIGYLPEERGLYQNDTVVETLTYLGSLKGMATARARARGEALLERVEMLSHADQKINELSRGMQQKIQFIVTIVHQPDLIVVDEPFAGLDPINTKLLKELLIEERVRGAAVIMSTHMMNQVEELCDRILMIDRGERVLFGPLREIKAEYAENALLLETADPLDSVEGVTHIEVNGKEYELMLAPDATPDTVLSSLMARGIAIERFEVAAPSLNEIFIRVVEDQR